MVSVNGEKKVGLTVVDRKLKPTNDNTEKKKEASKA
jgi:hypothetical protein